MQEFKECIECISSMKDIEPLLILLSTILWGIYVFYTIRTFREIKKQTDLQSQAFLIVSAKLQKLPPPIAKASKRSDDPQKLFDKWNTILKNQIQEAVQPEQHLILQLKNRGRSDIIYWEIKVNMEVFPGRYLQEEYNIGGDNIDWIIKYEGYEDTIGPSDEISIQLAPIGAFPKVKLQWSVTYKDIREVNYSQFAGDSSYNAKNTLALPNPDES